MNVTNEEKFYMKNKNTTRKTVSDTNLFTDRLQLDIHARKNQLEIYHPIRMIIAYIIFYCAKNNGNEYELDTLTSYYTVMNGNKKEKEIVHSKQNH